MRTPKYIDVDLLRQMADFYDVPVPHDAQVTRRVVDMTDRGLGFDKIAKGHADRTATEEVTESYQSELRPAKLFNDIIDELLVSDRVCDLTQDASAQIIHRYAVLVEGGVELAPASEVGEIMAKFMPMLTGMMAEGRTEFEPTTQELAKQFFQGEHVKAPHIMVMAADLTDYAFYFVLDPSKFAAGSTLEDLAGEVTVFGLAERIIREGSMYSLDKHVVPGLNRTMRRLLGKDAMSKLAEATAGLRGGTTIDPDDLNIRGPAVIVNVAGIFM